MLATAGMGAGDWGPPLLPLPLSPTGLLASPETASKASERGRPSFERMLEAAARAPVAAARAPVDARRTRPRIVREAGEGEGEVGSLPAGSCVWAAAAAAAACSAARAAACSL